MRAGDGAYGGRKTVQAAREKEVDVGETIFGTDGNGGAAGSRQQAVIARATFLHRVLHPQAGFRVRRGGLLNG